MRGHFVWGVTVAERSTSDIKAELAALDIEILDDEFRRRAEEDHMFFCRYVLGYNDLEDELHGSVSDIVNDTTKLKKLLLLPRGHLKSSLVTIGWTLWRLVQNPNRTFGIFNETQDLAEAFLREIKDHLEGPAINKYWPNLCPAPDERRLWNRSAIIVNRRLISRNPSIEAKSVQESTAGRHPDAMILDDPISDRTVQNEDQLAKSKQKFRELQALLDPPNDSDPVKGTMIVIGTRWHWHDLYSFIMDNLGEYYDVHVRKALEDGRCIFPKKFSRETLRELRKTMGEWVFSSQMMNEPVDSESALFSAELIKRQTWKGDREEFLERVPNRVFMAVDPAWEGDDATGIVVGCMTGYNKIYVLDAVRSRLKPDDMLSQVVMLAQRWRVEKIGFEGVIGGQEWMIKHLQDRLSEAQYSVPVIPLSHGNRAKEVRIMGLQPELNSKRLYVHEGCEDLRVEFLQFPRSGYRDLIDATEMLVRTAAPPSRMRAADPAKMVGTAEYEMAQMIQRGRSRRSRRYLAR